MANRRVEAVTDFTSLVFKIFADGYCSREIKGCLLLTSKAVTNLGRVLKSRELVLPRKVHIVKAIVFPVVVYRCESWTIKKPEPWRIDSFKLWCWRRLLRVPWTSRRAKAKENQPCIFIGRIDAEAEAPILWPPDLKSWLIRKDPDAEKDWRQEEKRTEDEMVGWHHRLNGHEFEQAPGDG